MAQLSLEQQRALALARARMRMQESSPETAKRQRSIATQREEFNAKLREIEGKKAAALKELEARVGPRKEGFFGNLSTYQGVLNPLEQSAYAVRQQLDALRGQEEFIAKTGRAPHELTTGERIKEPLKAIPRGAIESVAQLTGLAGTLGSSGEAFAKRVEGGGKSLVEALGLEQGESVAEALQFDPMAKQLSQLGGGFGSVVPYVGAELLTGGGATPALLGRAAQLSMATGQGATQARQQIEDFEKETGQQVDSTTRRWVQLAGGAINLTELLPIPAMVGKLPAPVREAINKQVTRVVANTGARKISTGAARAELGAIIRDIESMTAGRIAVSATEESLQEGGSQAAQNVLEKLAYNPNQAIGEDVADNALLGGLVGGGVRGGTELVRREREEPPEEPPAPEATSVPSEPGAPTPPSSGPHAQLVAELLNVGYPQQEAERTATAMLLQQEEATRRAEKPSPLPELTPQESAAVEEPRRAMQPLTKEAVSEARKWINADIIAFEDELLRQPTSEERHAAAELYAQDPAYAPIDLINAVMEKNDRARPPVAEAAPVAPAETPSVIPKVTPDIETLTPEAQFGEQLGTFKTTVNLNGQEETRVGNIAPPPAPAPAPAPVEPAPAPAPTPAPAPIEPTPIEPAPTPMAERPRDIAWRESKEKYPGVMNFEGIAFIQGFAAVDPTAPGSHPVDGAELRGMPPERRRAFVEGMQRSVELNGMDVQLPALPSPDEVTPQEFKQATDNFALIAKAATLRGYQANMQGAPLERVGAPKMRKDDHGNPYHVLELNDGTEVKLFRDTDQYGAHNPVWYVEDPLSTEAPGWEGHDVGLGSTKKEALERVASKLMRGRQNTLDMASELAAPEPEAMEPEVPAPVAAPPIVEYKKRRRLPKPQAVEPEPAPVEPAPTPVEEVAPVEPAPVEPEPEFIPNPLPNDVDEWTKLHVGKTQKENAKLVERRKQAERNAVEMELPIASLIGIEDQIGRRALESPSTELPYIEKANGKYYIVDGNHRVVAQHLKGATTIRARVGDLDANTVPEPEPEPESEPEVSDKQRADGELVAGMFTDGQVVYQNGDIGLVRAYNQNSGKPVYVPFKGTRYVGKDISTVRNELTGLTVKHKAELQAAADALEAKAAEQHAAAPSITYDSNGLALSQSIPENMAGVIAEWKSLLLDPDVKLYVTTAADAQANKGTFTGPHRAVDYATTKSEEDGRAVQIGPNEYFIIYKESPRPTKVLETLAHEMGHVHMWSTYNNASKNVQAALRGEHVRWLERQKDKTAKELIAALRGRAMARDITGDLDVPAEQLTAYWRSFKEWYADQVARWAVSSDKPVSIVEKFFARLGKAMRQFYQSLRAQRYLPTETFSKYMENATRNLELSNERAASYEDVLNELEGAYQGDPTGGIEPQISKQTYNLLRNAIKQQKASPEELTTLLQDAIQQYAGESYGGAAKSKVESAAESVAKANKKTEKATAAFKANVQAQRQLEASGLLDPLSDSFNNHNPENKRGIISGLLDAFRHGNLDKANLWAQLATMPTRDLMPFTDLLSSVEPKSEKPMRRARKIKDMAAGMRGTMLNAGIRHLENLHKFVGSPHKGEGQRRASALYGALDVFRANAFNPTIHKSLDAALADDTLIEAARDNLAKAKRPQEQGKARKQIKQREEMIRNTWRYWDALGKFKGGHEAAKELLDYYATMTRAARAELDGLLKSLRKVLSDEELDLISTVISEADKGHDVITEAREKGDLFDDIPAHAFPVVYVPWNRFGKYVLQVKPEFAGPAGGERYQFTDVASREIFATSLAKQLGVDPNDKNVFERHSDLERARRENEGESQVLQRVVKLVREVPLKTEGLDLRNAGSRGEAERAFRKNLEERLTELVLSALPEESIRKQFIRAKGVTGRSMDHAHVLAHNVVRYSNQLPRLKYGYQLEAALTDAMDQLADKPGSREHELAETLLTEVGNRFRMGLNPNPTNPLISAVNSFGHTMMLSAPASAINNAITVWQRAVADLGVEYGTAKAAATLGKLEGVMRLMGTVNEDPTGSVRSYIAPSLIKLSLIRDNPVYRKAFLEMRDSFNLFGHGFIQQIAMEENPLSITGVSASDPIRKGLYKVTGVINAPFAALERITNEKVAMASFMLEYEKQKKAGKTDKEAYDIAIDAGYNAVSQAIGRFDPSERPKIFTGAGSLLFLFKFFPLQIGSFIIKQLAIITSPIVYELPMKAVDIARGRKPKQRQVFTKAEKRRATKLLTAIFAGNFIWTGAAGTFGFSAIANALAPFIFMFMDDDEREEWAREHPEYVNDMPGYVIEKLIPETFGGYGDMVAYGPVSAATGISFSSRLGYDNLFFKDPVAKTDDTWLDTKAWFAENFGAGVNRADDFMKGVGAFMDGDWRAAARGMLPAGAVAPMKGYEAATEGIVTAKGNVTVRPEEVSLSDAVIIAMGYQPLKLNKTYGRLYGQAEQLGAIEAEKRNILRKLNRAQEEDDYEAEAEIEEDIDSFNSRYPDRMIDDEARERSSKSYTSRKERMYRGVEFKPEDRERVEEDVEKYWEDEE